MTKLAPPPAEPHKADAALATEAGLLGVADGRTVLGEDGPDDAPSSVTLDELGELRLADR